jgi:hypothetical protein
MWIILFSFLLIAPPGSPTTAKPGQGSIVSDWTGTDWRSWNDTQKGWYLWGFRAGTNAGMNAALKELGVAFNSAGGKRVQRRVGVAASIAQIQEGVDAVYKDYRNINLPLWNVVYYVIDSIGGFADDGTLEAIRRAYSRPIP